MSKKILLVSGCSWGDKNWQSLIHPDLDVFWLKWPELLADKLDMKVVNLCRSGAGQEYIYSSLLDKLTDNWYMKDVGLVVAAWSTAPRRDYISTAYGVENKQWTNESMINEPLLTAKGCIEHWIEKSLRYYYTFQNVCENLNVPFRQVQMVNLYQGYLWEKIKQKRMGIDEFGPGSIVYKKLLDNKIDHKTLRWNPNVVKCDTIEDLMSEDKNMMSEAESWWKHTYHKKLLNQIKVSPYYKAINPHYFLGWPMEESDGGFSFNDSRMKIERISKNDAHPSAKGQRQIATHMFNQLKGTIV